jgi:hypothetical protein
LQNPGRLLASYVVTTIFAAAVLVGGIFVWLNFVPPASVAGAVVVSQLTLLLLLIPRFWQRGVMVTYYLQHMVAPIVVQSFTPASVVPPVISQHGPTPVAPSTPPEPQAS